MKSLLDFILASVCLIICLPSFALTALAIKIDSPGPVFCRQEWVAKNGRIVKLIRFRSTRESRISPFLINDDTCATRVGPIIVKLGIDELPELINVLRGEMSFFD